MSPRFLMHSFRKPRRPLACVDCGGFHATTYYCWIFIIGGRGLTFRMKMTHFRLDRFWENAHSGRSDQASAAAGAVSSAYLPFGGTTGRGKCTPTLTFWATDTTFPGSTILAIFANFVFHFNLHRLCARGQASMSRSTGAAQPCVRPSRCWYRLPMPSRPLVATIPSWLGGFSGWSCSTR